MTLKGDAKFEEKPICCFKNDKNLVNFDPSIQVSKICTSIGHFRAKYTTFDLKQCRGVIFHDTEELNLANFHQSTQKCQNWDFDRILFCPKQQMHELKIYRGVMCNDMEE